MITKIEKLKYTDTLLKRTKRTKRTRTRDTILLIQGQCDIANTKTKKVFSKLTEQISDILNIIHD